MSQQNGLTDIEKGGNSNSSNNGGQAHIEYSKGGYTIANEPANGTGHDNKTSHHGSCGCRTTSKAWRARPDALANPAPAGLLGFAATTFLLSLYNLNTRGVMEPNVVVGMSLFGGGLVQLLAGLLEFPRGNVFGATAFASYGAFWLSYSAILLPGTGVIDAFMVDGVLQAQQLNNAIGIYLMVWLMITMMFMLPVINRHVAFTTLLSTLSVAYILLASGSFTGEIRLTRAGGGVGIFVGLVAFYIACSEMLSAEEHPIIRLPMGIRTEW